MKRFLPYIREVLSAGTLENRMYFVGYAGLALSRGVRRVLARGRLHRAWLRGHLFLFTQDGRPHGVFDRDWYNYRKGRKQEVGTFRQVLGILLCPYGF